MDIQEPLCKLARFDERFACLRDCQCAAVAGSSRPVLQKTHLCKGIGHINSKCENSDNLVDNEKIAYFEVMMKESAKNMTPSDITTLAREFVAARDSGNDKDR